MRVVRRALGDQQSAFTVPAYPYDQLAPISELADRHSGGKVDLSVGTPCDPPPDFVLDTLGSSGTERGYPFSVGSTTFRTAAANWMKRRFGVEVGAEHVAACVGTKELVATVPSHLKLRIPDRDTVLYPEISYPTYAFGATIARCRAVGVPAAADGGMDFSAISEEDAARAVLIWVNTPSNPTGAATDLSAAAAWGRSHAVPVFSDECYSEFTWSAWPPPTILQQGLEGVVAVHSLSKRSNLAGLRAGFYAGDPELVDYLSELRKHCGLMVPGPVQAAASVALDDDAHVLVQRDIYVRRLRMLADIFAEAGIACSLPGGGFYLWVESPTASSPGAPTRGGERAGSRSVSDADWAFTEALARSAGMLVSPGSFYGEAGRSFVRVAAVQPDDRIELAGRRLCEKGFELEAPM